MLFKWERRRGESYKVWGRELWAILSLLRVVVEGGGREGNLINCFRRRRERARGLVCLSSPGVLHEDGEDSIWL